jgi:hypothetical protein
MDMIKPGRRNSFLGQDGFIWWVGVVIDRQDPLHLGRCKIRIKGVHEDDTSKVSNENLPWAQPLNPVNNSFQSPSTLKEGDIVIGFFMDGEHSQFPIVFGTLPIIPEKSNDNKSTKDKNDNGYSDQRTDEQLKSAPQTIKNLNYQTDGKGVQIENEDGKVYPTNYDEPTTSRLSRNESTDKTIVETKKNSRVKKIKIFDGESTWDEPENKYKAKYPYNHVIETESGHFLEFDDTKDSERIHLYHRSGTFSEINPDGSKVEKITKNNYEIILADDNVYIMGKCNITVQGDANIKVQSNCNLQIDKDMTFNIKQNLNFNVDQNVIWNIKGKMNWNVDDNVKWKFNSSCNWDTSDNLTITASKIQLN